MKNPKAKGALFERRVCKELSLWVSRGKRDDLFWRSSMSGGRATLMGESRTQSGDISPIDASAQLFTDIIYFELKHYRDADFAAFFRGSRTKLVSELIKSKKQADENSKLLWFIIKQNHVRTVCFVDIDIYDAMRRNVDVVPYWPTEFMYLMWCIEHGLKFVSITFDDVLRHVDPIGFINSLRDLSR